MTGQGREARVLTRRTGTGANGVCFVTGDLMTGAVGEAASSA